jgi:hypothetical protein
VHPEQPETEEAMTHGAERQVCPSCRVRFRVEPMRWREYNAVRITTRQLQALELAALHFDRESDERFTAIEFVRWIRPDVPGTPEYNALRRSLIVNGTGEESEAAKQRRLQRDRERQRDRYHSDPEYRQRQLEANKRYREKGAA